MKISPKKIGLVHVAKSQLGLEEADYRHLLEEAAGVTSAADLDEEGFARLMFRLEKLGFKSKASKRNYGHRPRFATPAQVGKARSLWLEFHGDDPDDVALNRWLSHFHSVSALRFVDAQKISAVMTALRAMVTRKRKAA